jgi:hypothetical protein
MHRRERWGGEAGSEGARRLDKYDARIALAWISQRRAVPRYALTATRAMPDFDEIARRLGDQMAKGEVILFTGAGFSHGAMDTDGEPIPQVRQLTQEIWDLL